MKLKWIVWVIPLMFTLVGCDAERYRYPCQDPDNWEQKQCKKPWCSANGTCPEDLTHYDKKNANSGQTPAPTPQVIDNKKGTCK